MTGEEALLHNGPEQWAAEELLCPQEEVEPAAKRQMVDGGGGRVGRRMTMARTVVVVDESSPSCEFTGATTLGAPRLVGVSSLQYERRRSGPAGADVEDEQPAPSLREPSVHEFVLQTLLRPGCAERQKSLVTLTTALATDVDAGTGKLRCTAVHSWNWDPATSTPLTEPQWMQLCYAAEHVLSQERSCLQLRAPIKVFGDLHGQFGDLLRLFEAFGAPSRSAPGGDLALCDYLFLGDYVDRGAHSLETVALLFALKVAHPNHVFLLRGNHESSQVNHVMGFFEECCERLGRGAGEAVWARINRCFDWLPLAAVIDGKALCLHGGIGGTLRTLAEIDSIRRPLGVPDGGAILTDILWSDPTDDDSITGVHPNTKRGPGTFSFGPDRVSSFCEDNGLDLVIRGHECVMDGFERFAHGQLVTVFSATNYCGVVNNSGCCMLIDRDLQCTPQIIVPNLPPAPPSPPTPLWPHGSEALDFQEPGLHASAFIDDGTAESRLEALCVASASSAEEAARHEVQLRMAFSAALEAEEEAEAGDMDMDCAEEGCGEEEGAECEEEEQGHGPMGGATRLSAPQGLRNPRARSGRAGRPPLRSEGAGTWRTGTFEALPPTPAVGLTAAEPAEAQDAATCEAAASGGDADEAAAVVAQPAAAAEPTQCEAQAKAAPATHCATAAAAIPAQQAAETVPQQHVAMNARLCHEGPSSPVHMAAGHAEEAATRLSTASSAAAVAVA